MSKPPSATRFLPVYAAAIGTMVLLDALWLGYSVGLFRELLGDMLLESVRLVPAAIFYLMYVALVVLFAVDWQAPDVRAAARRGAGLGLIGYGTYELTNYATVAAWSPKLVVIDMAWGVFVTSCVAAMAQFVASKR